MYMLLKKLYVAMKTQNDDSIFTLSLMLCEYDFNDVAHDLIEQLLQCACNDNVTSYMKCISIIDAYMLHNEQCKTM